VLTPELEQSHAHWVRELKSLRNRVVEQLLPWGLASCMCRRAGRLG